MLIVLPKGVQGTSVGKLSGDLLSTFLFFIDRKSTRLVLETNPTCPNVR